MKLLCNVCIHFPEFSLSLYSAGQKQSLRRIYKNILLTKRPPMGKMRKTAFETERKDFSETALLCFHSTQRDERLF